MLKQEDPKRLAYTGLRGQTYSKPSPSGHAAGNCRPGHTLKKPKYLSACDREERGRGEGAVCMLEGPTCPQILLEALLHESFLKNNI